MSVVITGASGFIGAHFCRHFLKQGYNVIGIDSFRHRGTWSRLNESVLDVPHDTGQFVVFYHDFNVPVDEVLAKKISRTLDDDNSVFINCASNSAVNRSISDPRECWENNTRIAINTLEYLRSSKDYRTIIQLSTDEVYGDYASSQVSSGNNGNGFKEWSPINPSNPYAASKAAQEALFISYWRTYGLPIVIANTMNNIGEWQDCEKFIPLVIGRLVDKKIINVYVDEQGNQGSRVYLDVKDHARMMECLVRNPRSMYPLADCPDRWNLCGNVEATNMEVVLLIAEIMGMSREETMPLVKCSRPDIERPGYDKRYLLDPAKTKAYFNFEYTDFHETLKRIVDFTLSHREWMQWKT